MKITEIDVIKTKLPWTRKLQLAGGVISNQYPVLVKVFTDDGIVGWGETTPQPEFTEATLESTSALLESYLSPAIIGEDPFNFEKIHILMRSTVSMRNIETTGQNAICAIDLALYDIVGKALNIPAYKLLGGKFTDPIPVSTTHSGARDPGAAVKQVKESLQLAGEIDWKPRNLKIKLGGWGTKGPTERLISEDVELCKVLHDNFPDLRIWPDPNSGWTSAKETIQAVKELERYCGGLVVVEQPMPRWNWDGYARVTSAVESPILMDESIQSIWDMARAIKMNACDAVSIKIPRVGGLTSAQKIAAMCEASGIEVMLGMQGENTIGHAAKLHFMASVPMMRHDWGAWGLTRTEDYFSDVEMFKPKKGNYVQVPDKPGLGIEVKEDVVEKYRQGEIVKVK